MLFSDQCLTGSTPKPNHRVVHPQDTCASLMDVGLLLYKRTDNLTESEPMVLTNGTYIRGNNQTGYAFEQFYKVPLHRDDQQYDTVSTGLVKIQPDLVSQGLIDFVEGFGTPQEFPPFMRPDRASYISTNGCPLSTRY